MRWILLSLCLLVSPAWAITSLELANGQTVKVGDSITRASRYLGSPQAITHEVVNCSVSGAVKCRRNYWEYELSDGRYRLQIFNDRVQAIMQEPRLHLSF